MDKKKNILKTIFSWLKYKEKVPPTFFIPEVSGNSTEGTGSSQKGMSSSSDNASNPGSAGNPSSNIDTSDSSDCGNFSNPGNLDNQQNVSSKKRRRTIINSKPVTPMPVTPAEKQKQSSKSNGKGTAKSSDNDSDKGNETCISTKMDANITFLKKAFNHPENKDIIIRKLCIANGTNVFIFYIDGMADRNTINLSILKPLLDKSRFNDMTGKNLFDYIFDSVIETHQLKSETIQEPSIKDVLTGNTGIFIDGFPYYILCETKGYEKRSVEKPQVEGVVKGSQEAFNENLRTNITLIRRLLKNRELTTNFHDIGERNNSKCAVIYLNNLVNPAIVNEVTRRIKGISTDLLMGDGLLEQYIEDSPLSIIPTILSTERPDRTVSHLIEGKVVILADGTPFALIVPITVADLLHTSEDTTLRWQYGLLLRFIRLFAIFVATLMPSLYVALTTFHREMIPTDLLIAIAKARENVPFATIVEVLLMELSFELIREAGIRIPGIIGNTLGIIGALILGQAAVQANLVSPVLIIVVAFTGLGNFAIPDFSLAFSARILRLFYIIAGSFLGFYGISLVMLVSLALTVNLTSFGVPVFSVLAPKTRRSYDLFLRWPVWKQEMRPDYLNPLDITRQPKISRKWTKAKSATGSGSNATGKSISTRKDSRDEQ